MKIINAYDGSQVRSGETFRDPGSCCTTKVLVRVVPGLFAATFLIRDQETNQVRAVRGPVRWFSGGSIRTAIIPT